MIAHLANRSFTVGRFPTPLKVRLATPLLKGVLKIIGVTLDSTLTFDDHVNNVVRSCNYHLRALRHLRPCLSLDVAKTMAASIVGSRLDYCNALFYGVTQLTMNKLQRQTTLHVSPAMLVDVKPTQLTYCVTYIGYQYVSG